MDNTWNLELMRWVIEDGEPELHVGDVFTWVALFQCQASLTPSTEAAKSAVLVEKNHYRVNAEVIYISQDPRYECCVLDFGITAISESGALLGMPLPPDWKEGDYVAGDVYLESPLCTDIQPYDIRHEWRVDRITAVSVEPGETVLREIADTASLKVPSYILHCTHLAGPPMVNGKPPIDTNALQYLKPFRADSGSGS